MTAGRATAPRTGKIHFVHHLEKRHVPANLGDWICSPWYYFAAYFARYSCVLHADWAILWHEIERGDIVIFGGGGLLDNSDALNRVLNRLLACCDTVIIWGAGTHRYAPGNIFGKPTASEPIAFERAALMGLRDYNHPSGLPYLPCVSCLHEAFTPPAVPVEIARPVGTITSALETGFAVRGLPSCVSNADPIGQLVQYIRASQTILVSSYHGAYWAMLLGRRAVLPASRLGVDKYRYFRHPVGIYDKDDFDAEAITQIAEALPAPDGFLEESRQLTLDFFARTRTLIEERLLPQDSPETLQLLAKRTAQMEFTLIEMWNEIRHLKGRLAALEQA